MRSAALVLLAVLAVGCRKPVLHPGGDYKSSPPPPQVVADRHCEHVSRDDREKCALEGNPVAARVRLIYPRHLRITLTFGQTIAGCGGLSLSVRLPTTAEQPGIQCREECMPEGPGGGTCWPLTERSFSFEVQMKQTVEPGTPVTLTSIGGHLAKQELVAREWPSLDEPYREGAGRVVCELSRYREEQRELAEESQMYTERKKGGASEAELAPLQASLETRRKQLLHLEGRDGPAVARPDEVFQRLNIPLQRNGRPEVEAIEQHIVRRVAAGALTEEEADCLRWLISRSGDKVMNPGSRGASEIAGNIASVLLWFGE